MLTGLLTTMALLPPWQKLPPGEGNYEYLFILIFGAAFLGLDICVSLLFGKTGRIYLGRPAPGEDSRVKVYCRGIKYEHGGFWFTLFLKLGLIIGWMALPALIFLKN